MSGGGGRPGGPTVDPTPTFRFTAAAAQAGATFLCKFDAKIFNAYRSPTRRKAALGTAFTPSRSGSIAAAGRSVIASRCVQECGSLTLPPGDR